MAYSTPSKSHLLGSALHARISAPIITTLDTHPLSSLYTIILLWVATSRELAGNVGQRGWGGIISAPQNGSKWRNASYIRRRCTWWTRVESPFLWLVVYITWAWKELAVPRPKLPSICLVLIGLTYSFPSAHVVALSDFIFLVVTLFFFLGHANI